MRESYSGGRDAYCVAEDVAADKGVGLEEHVLTYYARDTLPELREVVFELLNFLGVMISAVSVM